MATHAEKTKVETSYNGNIRSQAEKENSVHPKEGSIHSPGIPDNRREAFSLKKLNALADGSPRAIQLQAYQQIANNSLRTGQVAQLRKMEKKAVGQKTVSATENISSLPGALKAGIETLSGFAMDDVVVHRASIKPAQVNAYAYAQGSHIHLGPGQEKQLPHEAWHVVQQKQGRVKPTKQLKGKVSVNDDKGLEKEADLMGGRAQKFNLQHAKPGGHLQKQMQGAPETSNPIQRVKKNVYVTGVSHLVKLKNGTLQGGEEDREVIQGQELVIDDAKKLKSKRGPNQEAFSAIDLHGPQHYDWYKVESIEGKKVPNDLYIRSDVFVQKKAEEAGPDKMDKTSEVVNAVTNVPATLIGNEGITGYADALNDKTVSTRTSGGPGASDSDKRHAANMGIVGDSITGITGLIGLAQGFKDLSNPEAETHKLIEAALSVEQNAMKTGESVSKLIHTASGSSTATTASKFGSTFEGFGAAFGGIKEAFIGMHKLVDLVNNHQDFSTEEKIKTSAEIGIHALQTGRSIVLSVKAFIELVDSAGASGHLMAAVPGLDIAISAVKIIMDSYYFIVSNSNRKLMNERRKALRQKQSGKDLDSASEFYRTRDAEIANKKAVIKADEKRLANPKTKDKDRIRDRVEKLKAEILILEAKESDDATRDEVGEFTMATELRDANTKRVTRQGIHIANEMLKIAGSIATLTGMGAQAGAAIKGATAAVDLALPATRMAKQAGRDRQARKLAKGKTDKATRHFDVTKSSAAKNDFRIAQVKYLIGLIIDLSYKDPVKDAADFKVVKNYLKASGVSTKKLFKENGNPQKQIKILLDAIQNREFI